MPTDSCCRSTSSTFTLSSYLYARKPHVVCSGEKNTRGISHRGKVLQGLDIVDDACTVIVNENKIKTYWCIRYEQLSFKPLLMNMSINQATMFIHQAPKTPRNIKSLNFVDGKQLLKSKCFLFSLMTVDTSIEKHDIDKRNMKNTWKFLFCEKVCSVPFIQMWTYFLYKKRLI